MRQDTAATRAKILNIAEKLFAEKGVEHVTLSDINKRSGQKNRSALQYHFGGKQQLIDAIMEKHLLKITSDRNRLLDEIDQESTVSYRSVAKAIVIPLTNCLNDSGGICYIQIASQLIAVKGFPHLLKSDLESHFSSERMWRYVTQLREDEPEAVSFSRVILMLSLLFQGLSNYIRIKSSERVLPDGLSDDVFVTSMIDSMEALLEKPPSIKRLG